MSPPEIATQYGTTGPPTSLTMDQDFVGKVIHCRHIFFGSICLRRTVQYWAKLPKAKEKPRLKWKKPEMCREVRQGIDRQL